jgi:hypothetical protein
MNEIEQLRARVESLEAVVADLLAKAPRSKASGVTLKTLTDAGMTQAVAGDFLIHRRQIKAPLTLTALTGIQREASKAGLAMDEAATLMMNRGWRGFMASWVKPEDKPSNLARGDADFLARLRNTQGGALA